MFINDYVPEEYTKVFDCEDGLHTVRIGGARICNSKNGSQMLEVCMAVDNIKTWYIERYVAGEYFNKNITRFFDAFGMQRGNFDFNTWKGKTARAWFEHELSEYTGSDGLPKTSNKSVLKRFDFSNSTTVPTQPAQPAQPAQTQMPQMGMQTAASMIPQGQSGVPTFSPAPAASNPNEIPPELSVFPEDTPF